MHSISTICNVLAESVLELSEEEVTEEMRDEGLDPDLESQRTKDILRQAVGLYTDRQKYQWENEEWYLAHKARWDALEAQGWQFRHPTPLHNRVGITIFREDDHYTMYVARTTPEEIHYELLERCEYHAARYRGVEA